MEALGGGFQLRCAFVKTHSDRVLLPPSLLNTLHESITHHELGPLVLRIEPQASLEGSSVFGSIFGFSANEGEYVNSSKFSL